MGVAEAIKKAKVHPELWAEYREMLKAAAGPWGLGREADRCELTGRAYTKVFFLVRPERAEAVCEFIAKSREIAHILLGDIEQLEAVLNKLGYRVAGEEGGANGTEG